MKSNTAVAELPRITRRFSIGTMTLKVQCGCGFIAGEVMDGVTHAESTGHTLTISGIIRVEK